VAKVWLKHYPPGVPAEINPDEYGSLGEMIVESCKRFADLPAYHSMGDSITYAELDARSKDFAAWLQNVARLEKGDRVAIMMPNLLQYPIALIGILRAGFTAVNVNPLYTARELQHQLHDSGAKAIVILENFAHVLEEVIEHTQIEHVLRTGVGDLLSFPRSAVVNIVVRHVRKQVPAFSLPNAVSFAQALRAGRFLTFAPPICSHDDIAFLQYTGGTTGVAKGAVLTHRNMISNVLQATSWLGTKLKEGEVTAITALPLYHIFSLTANCLTFMKLGGFNVLIANPRDFPAFVKTISQFRVSFFSGVNTLFNALLNTPGFDKLDFSALKLSLGGGMAVQKAVAERWKQVTGNVLTQAWGLTETSPAAAINPFEVEDFTGSIGLPIPSTEISVRDDAGNDVGLNQTGEICVRGPQVMREYWQRPDETAKVMMADGWLRTGDIGYMDDKGFVFLQDRKKDMILVSGFNVYPNEVEDVVIKHPGVLEVAAVAQPDERAGEVVAIFVVRKDPSLTAQQVIDFCRSELTGYKIPKHVYFKNELPKTNVGKILRRALRDELSGKPLDSGPPTQGGTSAH
jgi:long-chain acyl-CoA synthetase